MVSGFHGNTDSVMVMFLVLAAFMCVREQPLWSALFMAMSCQIKIVPLLLVPILFFFWMARGAAVRFAVVFSLACAVGWIQPLTHFPALLFKNVLSYGSFWTHAPMFKFVPFFNLLPAEAAVALVLKVLIIGSVLLIAWRRRKLTPIRLFDSVGYAWLIFFAISPGVCAQYTVWLAPFVLLLEPTLYAWITGTSALFLFYFYNITSGGLPWYFANSTNQANPLWTPWAAWPWAAILIALVMLWRRAKSEDPALPLVSAKLVR